MPELTPLQQKAFDEIWAEWKQRYGDRLKEERKEFLRQAIIDFDKRGDMMKPVVSMEYNKTFLVPIKDIILYGLNGSDLGTKYKEETQDI